MPTYVYETIPQQAGERPRRLEIHQRMSEDALTADPATGAPVRRVPAGGIGIITGKQEAVPCANGSCMLPPDLAEQGGCGAGLCGE